MCLNWSWKKSERCVLADNNGNQMLELSLTSKCQLLATNQEDMTPKIKIERWWGMDGNKHNVFGFVKPYYNVKTNWFIAI